MRTIQFIMVTLLLVTLGANSPEVQNDPVAVFADLDGVWTGTFVGFDESGRELYRIAVRQEYKSIDANTQTVRVRDEMADGTVITGEGKNTARRRPDGTLELKCIVRKSNGERVVHDGRLIKGPQDREQLIWYSKTPNRTETFREQVFEADGRTVYEINGMGRYNGTLMLMTGRYLKQDDA